MVRRIPGYEEIKTVLVIGFGKTGQSFLQYFSQYDVRAWVTDTRLSREELVHRVSGAAAVSVWDEQTTPLSDIDIVAVSPGVPMTDALLQRVDALSIPVCSDMAFFLKAVDRPIIAITGSNGKTTVTTLVAELLQAAGYAAVACGNIGLPVLALLDQAVADYYVCEVSSAQLARSPALQATVAVCLNITDNHLNWHGSMAHYVAAKKSIYTGCTVAVCPAEDVITAEKVLTFSANTIAEVTVRDGHYVVQGEPLLPVTATHLQAAHEQSNVCAALACVLGCGVDVSTVIPALQSFQALPHRCQKVGTYDGVLWVNDSKATNVAAACAGMTVASEGLSGQLIVIMGGLSKGADLTPLIEPIARFAKSVLVMGADADRFVETLSPVVTVTPVSGMEEAVAQAAALAVPGDAVLLAPACDSRDMFVNYEQRGQLFCDLVTKRYQEGTS